MRKNKLKELFKAGKYKDARTMIVSQARPEEYEEVYKFMYRNLELWGKTELQQDQAIVIIRNGIANPLNMSGGEVSIMDIIAGIAINICKDNFIFPFKPEEEFLDSLIQSSITPMEPKPTIISNTVQTN